MAALFEVKADLRALARVKKSAQRWQGKPLADRMSLATLGAARLLVRPIRSEAPKGPTGNLKASIRAGSSTRTKLADGSWVGGQQRRSYVGPGRSRAPHRHLVIRGHRIVTPGGRDTGRRTGANDFVDRAVRRDRNAALAAARREIVKP